MPTALPAASVATNATATQADVKNWLTSLHDYLAGLLGTDGVTATAVAALGITGPSYPISVANGGTAAVTAAAAADNLSVVKRDHGDVALGSFVYCAVQPNTIFASRAAGTPVSGASLQRTLAGGATYENLPGTWRVLFNIFWNGEIWTGSGLAQRIA